MFNETRANAHGPRKKIVQQRENATAPVIPMKNVQAHTARSIVACDNERNATTPMLLIKNVLTQITRAFFFTATQKCNKQGARFVRTPCKRTRPAQIVHTTAQEKRNSARNFKERRANAHGPRKIWLQQRKEYNSARTSKENVATHAARSMFAYDSATNATTLMFK